MNYSPIPLLTGHPRSATAVYDVRQNIVFLLFPQVHNTIVLNTCSGHVIRTCGVVSTGSSLYEYLVGTCAPNLIYYTMCLFSTPPYTLDMFMLIEVCI